MIPLVEPSATLVAPVDALKQALVPKPDEANVPVGTAVNVDVVPGTHRIS